MESHNQYARYRQDATVLTAIGNHVGSQVPQLTVRLPRSLAEAAVAAWTRDELDDIGEETREEYLLRDQAADLALIGLVITERGTWDGDELVVDLDVIALAAAMRAAQ